MHEAVERGVAVQPHVRAVELEELRTRGERRQQHHERHRPGHRVLPARRKLRE